KEFDIEKRRTKKKFLLKVFKGDFKNFYVSIVDQIPVPIHLIGWSRQVTVKGTVQSSNKRCLQGISI
ncbi:8968_t:CDS:2, partial [Dentiscutata erythropus]